MRKFESCIEETTFKPAVVVMDEYIQAYMVESLTTSVAEEVFGSEE